MTEIPASPAWAIATLALLLALVGATLAVAR